MSEQPAAIAWLETPDGPIHTIGANCRLGRSADNEIVVRDDNVSRFHAMVHLRGEGEFLVSDLGSKNGTLLNGRRIIWPMPLRDGDRIQIAQSTFVFHQVLTAAERAEPELTISGVTRLEIRYEPCFLLIADLENAAELGHELTPEALATRIGSWLRSCRETVESRGGVVDKFLGDGLLAFWREERGAATRVADALACLQTKNVTGQPRFRVVVHHGNVALGMTMTPGEEIMTGDAVNFIFRMEKLASAQGVSFCVSSAAEPLLAPMLPLEPLSAEYELKGFPGMHRFFRLK